MIETALTASLVKTTAARSASSVLFLGLDDTFRFGAAQGEESVNSSYRRAQAC